MTTRIVFRFTAEFKGGGRESSIISWSPALAGRVRG